MSKELVDIVESLFKAKTDNDKLHLIKKLGTYFQENNVLFKKYKEFTYYNTEHEYFFKIQDLFVSTEHPWIHILFRIKKNNGDEFIFITTYIKVKKFIDYLEYTAIHEERK